MRMARGRRKVTTTSLDDKIELQKTVLEKAKIKYEKEKETMAQLVKFRNEMWKEELMDAVIKSKRSYSEIMAFIKGRPADEDWKSKSPERLRCAGVQGWNFYWVSKMLEVKTVFELVVIKVANKVANKVAKRTMQD